MGQKKGYVVTEETRNKIRKTMKAKKRGFQKGHSVNIGRIWSKERNEKLAKTRTGMFLGNTFGRGYKHTAEAKVKMSLAKKGKTRERANKWQGNNVTKGAKHLWIKRHYGKADHCENNTLHKSKRYEWANISGKYLREVTDYRQLCTSCHRKYDNAKRKTND